jgi:Tol biopolymer transport system component
MPSSKHASVSGSLEHKEYFMRTPQHHPTFFRPKLIGQASPSTDKQDACTTLLALPVTSWLQSAMTGVCLVALLCVRAQVGLAGESIEGRCLKNVRQVTSGFVKAGEGYFSPNGKTIVYQAIPREYPFYQIYTQSLAPGSRPKLISTGRGRTTCSYFHPRGQGLIFASSHLDPQLDATEAAARKEQEEDRKSGRRRRYKWVFDPHMEIFRAGLDGRDLVRLTSSPGYDAECAYSPDGRQIVFCSDRDGDPDIYIMNADGTGLKQLTNADGYDGGPFFSPDGNWVVYRTDRKAEDHLQIHTIRSDGTNDVALTDNIGVNWAPYWHPVEPYIIWCGADHSDPRARPNYDLWLMKYDVQEGRLAKTRATRITDHRSADVLPVFSPDGKQLMWTSNRTDDGSSQLWIGDFTLPDD